MKGDMIKTMRRVPTIERGQTKATRCTDPEMEARSESSLTRGALFPRLVRSVKPSPKRGTRSTLSLALPDRLRASPFTIVSVVLERRTLWMRLRLVRGF
ncbi:unnamed protein product [Lasius platythorax]|uniref:Uncharacterized protein n=1 Tax=Lasius platythorax TaxID=488582 RepID=A0AAV2P4Y7_9HYME